MENYIVRIYRRDETDPDKVAGIFESVENETRNTFTSLDTLIELLTPQRSAQAASDSSCEHKPVRQRVAATLSK